jgi:hypothetical protein
MVRPPFAVAGEVAGPLQLLLWWQWLFCCVECKMTWSCRTPFSSLFLNLLRTIRIANILAFVPTILKYLSMRLWGSDLVMKFTTSELWLNVQRNWIYNLITEFDCTFQQTTSLCTVAKAYIMPPLWDSSSIWLTALTKLAARSSGPLSHHMRVRYKLGVQTDLR